MTGGGPATRAARRMRARQELQLVTALWRADRPMADGWWSLLTVRGLLPAGFSIATGVLVGAIQHRASLAIPPEAGRAGFPTTLAPGSRDRGSQRVMTRPSRSPPWHDLPR